MTSSPDDRSRGLWQFMPSSVPADPTPDPEPAVQLSEAAQAELRALPAGSAPVDTTTDGPTVPWRLSTLFRDAAQMARMQENILRAFEVPRSILGERADREAIADGAQHMVMQDIEAIAQYATTPPPNRGRLPRMEPMLRVWQFVPSGEEAMLVSPEFLDLVINPAEGHGRVEPPWELYALNVEVVTERVPRSPMMDLASWREGHPDRIEINTRSRVQVRVHVRAWSPFEQRMVTVSHRDALLGLALATARTGAHVLDPAGEIGFSIGPNGRIEPVGRRHLDRAEALRTARQVAEIARHMPDRGRPSRAEQFADDVAAPTVAQRTLSHLGLDEARRLGAELLAEWSNTDWRREQWERMQRMPAIPISAEPIHFHRFTGLAGPASNHTSGARAELRELSDPDLAYDPAEAERQARRVRQEQREAAERAVIDRDPVALREQIAATLAAIDAFDEDEDLVANRLPDEPVSPWAGGSAWSRQGDADVSDFVDTPTQYVTGPEAEPAELEAQRAKLPEPDFRWLP